MISTVSLCIHVKGVLQMEKAVSMLRDKCSSAASKSKNERNVVWKGPPEVIHSSNRLKVRLLPKQGQASNGFI